MHLFIVASSVVRRAATITIIFIFTITRAMTMSSRRRRGRCSSRRGVRGESLFRLLFAASVHSRPLIVAV